MTDLILMENKIITETLTEISIYDLLDCPVTESIKYLENLVKTCPLGYFNLRIRIDSNWDYTEYHLEADRYETDQELADRKAKQTTEFLKKQKALELKRQRLLADLKDVEKELSK